MNRILATGKGSYQAARDVNVQNHFSQTTSHLSWITAMSRAMHESVIVFDDQLQIICANNAWGTFDNYPGIRSLNDIVSIVSDMYHNPLRLKEAIEITANLMEPRNFVLHMVQGTDVICRSYPAIDQGVLVGVILTAWQQQDSNTKQRETSMYTIAA